MLAVLALRFLQPASTGIPLADSCWLEVECVEADCCHADRCIHRLAAPSCSDVGCTMDCEGDTMDCGGRCACDAGRCTAQLVPRQLVPRGR